MVTKTHFFFKVLLIQICITEFQDSFAKCCFCCCCIFEEEKTAGSASNQKYRYIRLTPRSSWFILLLGKLVILFSHWMARRVDTFLFLPQDGFWEDLSYALPPPPPPSADKKFVCLPPPSPPPATFAVRWQRCYRVRRVRVVCRYVSRSLHTAPPTLAGDCKT